MISLLVPSRGRPENIDRLWASVMRTATVDWELVVRLDDDDFHLHDYDGGLPRTRWLTGPRILMSELWNDCWSAAAGDVFWHGGDDVTFNTTGWDRMVLDAFPADGIAFVHGDDLGGKGDQLGTHGFVTRAWTDKVGTFTPPYFSSDWNDKWLNDVADALGRRVFLPGMVTEHHHPAFGKAEWDATHNERVVRHWADDVDGKWAATADERDLWVAKLRTVMR